MEPKNKGHTNFYECCDLTKKYIYCTCMTSYLVNAYVYVFCTCNNYAEFFFAREEVCNNRYIIMIDIFMTNLLWFFIKKQSKYYFHLWMNWIIWGKTSKKDGKKSILTKIVQLICFWLTHKYVQCCSKHTVLVCLE